MSPPSLPGIGSSPGLNLLQNLLNQNQQQSLSLNLDNPLNGDDGGDDGRHGPRHAGVQGGPNSLQSGSPVQQAYASVLTGPGAGNAAQQSVLNTIMELPGGVALLRMLSHGHDAVPPGIAKQLNEVVQQLQQLAGGQTAPQGQANGEARQLASANPVAQTLAGQAAAQGLPANAAVVNQAAQGAPLAGGLQAQAASAASQSGLASNQAVATAQNTLATAASTAAATAAPTAVQVATPAAVPQAGLAAQAAPTPTVIPGMPMAANVAANAATAAALAGNTAAQASAMTAAAMATTPAAAQAAVAQGATMANAPNTVAQANFVNPHAQVPQGTTFTRNVVAPVDARTAFGLARDGAYTGSGPARERIRRDVRQLPRRMHQWLARMGLVKPDAFARHNAMDEHDQGLQQWLYWMLAIVAMLGCGLMLFTLLPSGAGMFAGTSRTAAGGFGLVAGVGAGLAAWWLRAQLRKGAPT